MRVKSNWVEEIAVARVFLCYRQQCCLSVKMLQEVEIQLEKEYSKS